MSDKELTLHRVNDPQDLETIYPTEVAGYPGFYYFPQDNRIAVSRHGAILNLKTGKVLKPVFAGAGRMQVAFTTPGVKARAYAVHRVIATTFIGRPSRHLDKPYSELEVNHIDGERRNNRPDNLEWVTSGENAQHSHLSGFNPKDKTVFAKNIRTNAVMIFHSAQACADHFNVKRATFWKHLETSNSCKFQRDMHVFKYDDGKPWPELDLTQMQTLGQGNLMKSVVLDCLQSGKRFILSNIKEATDYVKIPYGRLWRVMTRLGVFENETHKVTFLK